MKKELENLIGKSAVRRLNKIYTEISELAVANGDAGNGNVDRLMGPIEDWAINCVLNNLRMLADAEQRAAASRESIINEMNQPPARD